jgi:hypothetical protein
MLTKEVRVCHKRDGYFVARSLSELDAELDRLTAQCHEKPMIVEVIDAGGNSLSIGLGRDKTLVHLVPTAGPYLASVGDVSAPGTSVFYFHGEWTEVRQSQLIPIPAARNAVRHWYMTGELTSDIRWSDRPPRKLAELGENL